MNFSIAMCWHEYLNSSKKRYCWAIYRGSKSSANHEKWLNTGSKLSLSLKAWECEKYHLFQTFNAASASSLLPHWYALKLVFRSPKFVRNVKANEEKNSTCTWTNSWRVRVKLLKFQNRTIQFESNRSVCLCVRAYIKLSWDIE